MYNVKMQATKNPAQQISITVQRGDNDDSILGPLPGGLLWNFLIILFLFFFLSCFNNFYLDIFI